MNIWYLSKYAQSPLDGSPTRQYFFAKEFAKKGHNVSLVYSRSNGNNKIPIMGLTNQITRYYEGVSIVRLKGPLINLGFNIKRIYSWLIFEIRLLYWALFKSQEKPDVIIVSSLSLLTFLNGIFLKKHFKCKLICEIRDIWPLTIIESNNLNKHSPIIRFLSYVEKKGYKYADKIVGSMGNLKEHIVNTNREFVDKVEYIPTGFDKDFYNSNTILTPELNSFFDSIPKKNFIIGYAGTIGKANCVDEIINVANCFQNDSVSFVIIGDGVLKDKLELQVRSLNLKKVHFLGRYPKNKIPTILKKCDILLNPWLSGVSTYKYGLSPNKWIEYMYSARPIIVSVDGYQNIINEANCGMFIKAGDIVAMVDAINYYRSLNKFELDKIGQNGKEYLLNNLTYSKLAQKYINLME
jgi:glycosyltransferase involved in cell wall biosynthesis